MPWYDIGLNALVIFWCVLLILAAFCGIMNWLANHMERR